MKKMMKRLALVMLALMLLGIAVLPAAMAAGQKVVSNSTSTTSVYAGMKTTLTFYSNGVQQEATNYNWKSNKTSVATVSSSGVVTGKKAGTATITATKKGNKKIKASIKVTVKRNKVDYINAKPAATWASYKNGAIRLKSVEIVSPTQVAVEYYVAFNFPSKWKATKINYVSDGMFLHNRYTGALVRTIVGGYYQAKSTKISGFKARSGKSVQIIKVTYSGSQVNCANIRLSDYRVSNSVNCTAKYSYKYPR